MFVSKHGKGCLDSIQFFFFSFSLPTTNTQLGLFSPGTSLPLVFQQTSPHTLSHTHTHHSTAILEKRLFVYDPFKKKKKGIAKYCCRYEKKCCICSFLGSGLDFLGGGECSRDRQRTVYEQFFILFLFSPTSPFFF